MVEFDTVRSAPTSSEVGALIVELETLRFEFACTYNAPSTDSVTPMIVIGEADEERLVDERLRNGAPVNNWTSFKLELTENCPAPIGNVERFVKVRSVTLEKEAPVDNEIPSGETMNKLPDESRLSGTLRLKPLDDEATPRITLL